MATVSILYDNRAADGLRPGWGFSAYIRAGGTVVLFDTGADRLVLVENARSLGCDLAAAGALVLSHEHCDHIGAVSAVLRRGLHLYAPAAFAKRFAASERPEIVLSPVKRPTAIVPGVLSTGQFGRKIPEQALLIDGSGGPALVTGCAHAGIVEVARLATGIAKRPPALVLGGFHLIHESDAHVRDTARKLLDLGIERIAPCHCTGDKAIGLLRDAFGDRLIEVQAGSRIEL